MKILEMENNISVVRHIPVRMCIVCRKRKTKDFLLRFYFDSNKKLNISTNYGKGVYLCRDLECINKLFSVKSYKKTYFDTMTKETYEKIMKYVDFLQNMSNSKEKNDEMGSL